MSDEHDIIVVSDLHLGRGKNPSTGRYYRLEAFFYDDDFAHFCEFLIEEGRKKARHFKLILNGDSFDLLRVDHDPDEGNTLREKRYGPALTPEVAEATIVQILEGHPVFVKALSEVLASGNDVVFLPGNHDIEMQWNCVQDKVRSAILTQIREGHDERCAIESEDRLQFRSWFYYEESRVWIEHGCQYDPENAFRFFLRTKLEGAGEELHKTEIDMPLGTFFQRFLYNKFGNITFLVPNSRSNTRYFRWMLINRPRLLAKVATDHFPFFWQVLRRITSGTGPVAELKEHHEAGLAELVSECPLGDKLHEIDELKRVEQSGAMFARRAASRAVKVVAYLLLATVLTTGLWTLGMHSIGSTTIGVGFKALLFLGLNFVFLTLVLAIMLFLLLRPAGPGPDPWLGSSAKTIAELINVPLVSFGHTHDEDITRMKLGRNAWYYNTGTWIAVFTMDAFLPRERVQYTFLRIEGKEGQLLHWSPGRSEARPVVLVGDE